MHRPTVAALALLLLVAGGFLLATASDDDGQRQSLAAGCLRVGIILGVLWLALPDVARPATRWTVLFVILAVLLLANNPKLIVVVLVFLVGFALLRPRWTNYVRGR